MTQRQPFADLFKVNVPDPEAVRQLRSAGTETLERIGREQFGAVEDTLRMTRKRIDILGNVESFSEYLDAEFDLAGEAIDRAFERGQNIADAAAEARDAYWDLFTGTTVSDDKPAE